MKGLCVDRVPLPCKAALYIKPLVLSWVVYLSQVSEEFDYSCRQLFREGCVQPAGLSSHRSCCSAQAPCPHALTHRSDAKWVSRALFNDIQQLFVIWHKSLAFSLVFLRFSQVLTAFVKCRHNPFKGHLSPPFPPFSFLNHTETNIVSKLLSAFKHSFTLSVSILLHACQSHLLLSVDKTKLALLRNNRLFWELYYFLNIVQIYCRVNWLQKAHSYF